MQIRTQKHQRPRKIKLIKEHINACVNQSLTLKDRILQTKSQKQPTKHSQMGINQIRKQTKKKTQIKNEGEMPKKRRKRQT